MLKIEKILFMSYYPIYFTCRNEKNELFLCLRADNTVIGLATKVRPETVIGVLQDKITLRDSFLTDKEIIHPLASDKPKIYHLVDDGSAADLSILPYEGAFMEVEENEFEEEIEFYAKSI